MSEPVSELGAIFDPFPYACQYWPEDCNERYAFMETGPTHEYVRFEPREQYEQNWGMYMAAWEAGQKRA